MLAPTHIVGGQFGYLCAAWWTGHEPHLAEAGLAAFAALLPDLDSRTSVLGRWVPWLSGTLENVAGHRTATHSVLALAAVIGLAWLLPIGYGLALVAGFASHALLDMMTPGGVAWFWPARARCVLPGNAQWRMEAMGRGELAFAVIFALLTWPVLVAADREVGLLGTVRDVIGDVAEARRHYDAHRSEADWWLAIEGQDNRAFRPVEGRYRVVGPYRAAGLILETPQGTRTVCRADACDWYARRAVLERGEPEQTTTQPLSARRTTVSALVEAIEPLRAAGRVYLVGEMQGQGFRGSGATVTANADRVTLRYATPADLEGQNGRLSEVELLIQVRHPPGTAVPTLALGDGGEKGGISPLLRRYLP